MTTIRAQKVPAVVDPKRKYSIEEWLAIEEQTGERYEYHEGFLRSVRAMAGGSGQHALLGANFIYAAGHVVRELDSDDTQKTSSCSVYSSDLRLMINVEQRYIYPDAAIICGKPEYDEIVATAAKNPVVVAEILSPTSARYDSGKKFDYYASLESLRTYVLISQESTRVEVRSRAGGPGTDWTLKNYTTLSESVHLPVLEVDLPMKQLYRNWEAGKVE